MNKHSDELHQVTELIVYKTNDLNVELENEFISKLINLQNLKLPFDCNISLVKEIAKLQTLKKIDISNILLFEEFMKSTSRFKSITVSNQGTTVSIGDLDFDNLNWPLEQVFFKCRFTLKSCMSLLKNGSMRRNLTELHIPYSTLDENAMKEISTLGKLRVVNLTSVKCGHVAEYVSKLKNLESLYLSHNSIRGGLSNFRNLTNITKLDLNYNNIGNEGANYLSSLTSLAYLFLKLNNISDEGLKNYSKLSNLLHLDLDKNEIGSIGANYLSDTTSINYLHLNDNIIGEEGLKNFGNLSKLKCLYLENNKIGNGFQYLSNCENLSILNVSSNNISEETVMKYCEKSPISTSILIISNNPKIGNYGFASLVKLSQLTSLKANDCGISDGGISQMVKNLYYRKLSISLHLEENYLTNDSLKKIINSKHIDKIERLHITNTNFEFGANYLNILPGKIKHFHVAEKITEVIMPEDMKKILH